MRRRFMKGLAAVSVGILLLSASVAGAQTTQPPLTMGQLAMLRAHPDESLVPSLRAALASADPGLRAVAARIVGIGRIRDLLPDTLAALTREQDQRVGAELMRAALFYGTLESSAAANAYLPRGGPPALDVYAEALARTAPSRLVVELPHLASRFRTLDDPRLPSIVAVSAGQYLDNRTAVVRAWLETATGFEWRSLLGTLGAPVTPEDQDIVLAALASSNADIRQETVWQVASWLAEDIAVAPAIVVKSSGPQPSAQEPVTWEAFGRELVFRLSTGTRTASRAEYIAREGTAHPADLRLFGELPKGLKAEAQAADTAFKTLSEVRLPDSGSVLMATTRAFDVPWPGFLTSLFAAAGCEPTSAPSAGLVTVTYRPDGRPESAEIDPGTLPKACAPVVSALTGLITIEPTASVKSETPQHLLLFGQRGPVTCADTLPRDATDSAPARLVANASSNIVEPERIAHRPPTYPSAAQREAVQGLVVLEGTITREGCVGSVIVRRSVRFDLDFAAALAVSQWTYKPARLNGKPVDVAMTLTVNFSLQ